MDVILLIPIAERVDHAIALNRELNFLVFGTIAAGILVTILFYIVFASLHRRSKINIPAELEKRARRRYDRDIEPVEPYLFEDL